MPESCCVNGSNRSLAGYRTLLHGPASDEHAAGMRVRCTQGGQLGTSNEAVATSNRAGTSNEAMGLGWVLAKTGPG